MADAQHYQQLDDSSQLEESKQSTRMDISQASSSKASLRQQQNQMALNEADDFDRQFFAKANKNKLTKD